MRRSNRIGIESWLVAAWVAVSATLSLLGSWLQERSFIGAINSNGIVLLLGVGLGVGLLIGQRWQAAAFLALGVVASLFLPLGHLGHWGWGGSV